MIHNHHQKTRFRSLTDRLCCIVVKETKILFNLDINKKHDMVEVRTQTRGSRIYRSVGRVKFVRPGGYVRLYGQKYYFRVIRNFTRRWALMISNDTQSPSEDSISQSY